MTGRNNFDIMAMELLKNARSMTTDERQKSAEKFSKDIFKFDNSTGMQLINSYINGKKN